jgi:peptidoglycan hydrolase CwlO-like protein
MTSRLCIRHLVFVGPAKEPAILHFYAGPNILYGPSDTGKSFVVDAIDFMLGGKGPLRDIPERVGYTHALLGLSTSTDEEFTIIRSTEGGPFRLFSGLRLANPDEGGEELSEQHNDKKNDNLSSRLLDRIGLAHKRLRKNKRGDQQSLSFRNLARLVVINEEEIIQKRSPLSDGNYTADTANVSTFKLLLTGVDDGALGTPKQTTPEQHNREGQAELLADLIRDHSAQIRAAGTKSAELPDQLERLQASVGRESSQLAFSEKEFRKLTERRRELLTKLDEGSSRSAEIRALLERFQLLDSHYQSDMARLRGMTEAGSLFSALGKKQCPLCGALPDHHRPSDACDGDVDTVVAAARAEADKIEARRAQLLETIGTLQKEGADFDRQLPRLEERLKVLSATIAEQVQPVKKMRSSYKQLVEKSAQVQGALTLYANLQELEARLSKLQAEEEQASGSANAADVELSTSTVDKFATFVHGALTGWSLPHADRVHFDLKTKDLVINGKSRISYGKGLRAITQSAFTIGLLDYCLANETPHPGFAIVDSPLLSYKEPEGAEDDMRSTSVDVRFFQHLGTLANNRQVIVVENRDPPSSLADEKWVQQFTGKVDVGRFGFFPLPRASSEDTEHAEAAPLEEPVVTETVDA